MFFFLCFSRLSSIQVEFTSGKPPVLTFFDKASGEETESINLEKLTLDEVRFGVCGHVDNTILLFFMGEHHPIHQKFCPLRV